MGNKQHILSLEFFFLQFGCGQNKTFDDCHLVLWETLINIFCYFITFVGPKNRERQV